MIRLTDTLSVAPSEIAEVEINPYRDGLLVHMKSGRRHGVPCDYGKSAWETQDRLVKEINACTPSP